MFAGHRGIGVKFRYDCASEYDAVHQLGVCLRIFADRSRSYQTRTVALDMIDALLAEMLNWDGVNIKKGRGE